MLMLLKRLKDILGQLLWAAVSYGCTIIVERTLPYQPSSRLLPVVERASQAYCLCRLHKASEDLFRRYMEYEDGGVKKERVLEHLEDGNICILAQKDNEIVGSLWVSLQYGPYPNLPKVRSLFEGKSYVSYIFVSPGFRGTGLAPFLLSEGLKLVFDIGLHKMATIINYRNKTSLGFFKKMGFEPTHKLYFFRIGPVRRHVLRHY